MRSLAQMEAYAVLILPEAPRLRPHNMRQGRGQRVMQGVWKIRGGRDNMYLKLEKASKQSGLCEAKFCMG